MFINDQETAVNLLDYEAILRTVVKLSRANVAVPLTIEIHGDRGGLKINPVQSTSVRNLTARWWPRRSYPAELSHVDASIAISDPNL